MKALVLLLMALSAPAHAAEVSAPVEQVVVFADRAEVTRRAVAPCEGQEAVAMTFPLLPSGLLPPTLRAEARGGAEAVGVAARLVTAELPLDPEARAIQEELDAIAEDLVELDDRASSARERQEAATGYANYLKAVLAEQAREATPELGRWAEALDLLQAERLQLTETLLEVALARQALERRRDLAQRKLAALGGEASRRGYEVRVSVACQGARRPQVELSYVVPGATWSPVYDLRFRSRGGDGVGPGEARIEVGAQVRQATGEDWTRARVVLSTARPRLGAAAPQPAPIYVDGQEVGRQRVLVQELEDRRGVETPGAGPAQDGPDHAALEDGGRAFSLSLPDRVTVRADARPYRFPVDTVRTEATGRRVTVPKLAPFVYRVVQLQNSARYPLLEGPVHVFRDGAYAGRLTLPYAAPGAPLELSLGPDESVWVARHELTDADRSPGFLQRTRRFEQAWRTELVNGAAGPVTVEVRENIPVSRVEDVRVSVDERATTSGFEHDLERGLLSWEVTLAPGATAHVDLGFTVRLPEDWEVARR